MIAAIRVSQVEKVDPCRVDGAASPPATDAGTVLCVLAIFILRVASLSLRLCFWPISFPEHPFHDVGRAVQHWDPLRLTSVEKANSFDVHEIHLLQIQSYFGPATLDLCFHLINVLRSQRPAQPNPRSSLTWNPFNPQSHRSLVESRFYVCNGWAIHNSLQGRDLEVSPILILEEFLFGEENAVDWQVPVLESASP
jgi:hypothetical protein